MTTLLRNEHGKHRLAVPEATVSIVRAEHKSLYVKLWPPRASYESVADILFFCDYSKETDFRNSLRVHSKSQKRTQRMRSETLMEGRIPQNMCSYQVTLYFHLNTENWWFKVRWKLSQPIYCLESARQQCLLSWRAEGTSPTQNHELRTFLSPGTLPINIKRL